MSKNAIIFHGTEGKPTDFWYPWLAEQLSHIGYRVNVPHYPRINRDPINDFLPQVLRDHEFNNDTVLIGHSAGATLILSILENIRPKIRQAILVAGFATAIPGDGDDPILQSKYDWETMRSHAGDFVFINSVNDPWGCNETQGKIMFDKLGGTQIIRQDGHFGSGSLHQQFPEFPLLARLVE